MEKPPLTKRQIANLSIGLLGIQFGWGLQNANMSAIYEKLGASPSLIPLLWLAGPVSALLAHPIIGFMSDRTWSRLGRRRPFLLGGAICSSIALFFMPTSPVLWIAATLLWVQDLSINSTMEPFRPFIADKLGDSQRTLGFAIQSFFIGIGAAFANVTPYILRYLGVSGVTETGIPHTVKYAFQFGAFFFLGTVLWTVITTKEDPPEDLQALRERQRASRGLQWVKEFFSNVGRMPATMKQFAVVQVFTWFGMFCIFMFFAPAVARHVFGATEPRSLLYNKGIEWAGVALGVYAVVSIGASLVLPRLVALTNRRVTHALCLTCGGLGLLSLYLIHNQYLVLLIMVPVGFAWASIHAMPYAILSSALPPDRMGAFMGMFSFFIAVPGITASLTFRPLVKFVFDNNPLYVVMMGGVCFLIAATLMSRVRDPLEQKQTIKVKGSTAESAATLVRERV
ncbi:MAG TPA: MFS transporter [Pyrinomonadaceae bacterium]|nr:MFS transporter [Pyrinomonadaceae bacterium]